MDRAERGALAGMRVLDLSQVMAGPFCTMLLADMGADVVKVEPLAGDATRRYAATTGAESPAFWALNRNKRSVALNLRDPAGAELCRRLAARADVLVENSRPGTLDRLGLGYDDLRRLNGGLIYASVSGYGQTGPYRDRGGFDLVAQGESGIMSVTGLPDGPPVKCGIPVCDLGAGLFITYGILAAYIHRARTGEGQRVETSLLDAGVALSVWEATEFFTTGRPPRPTGSGHRVTAPYRAFRCQDGYVTIGAANQTTWERLCRVLGLEDLLTHEEFATDGARVSHRDELEEAIEAQTLRQPRAYWLEALTAAGIPCGPINTYADVFAHPQVAARGMVQEIAHPAAGRIRQIGPAVKASVTPPQIRRAAPRLGEHTREVLAEAGYPGVEIDALAAEGVIKA